jgi:hypothetical protein
MCCGRDRHAHAACAPVCPTGGGAAGGGGGGGGPPPPVYAAPVVDTALIETLTRQIKHEEDTMTMLRGMGENVAHLEGDLQQKRQELERAKRGA